MPATIDTRAVEDALAAALEQAPAWVKRDDLADAVREQAATPTGEQRAAAFSAVLKAALAQLTERTGEDEQAVKAAMDAVLTKPAPLGRTAAQLRAAAPAKPDWIVPGVAARGWMVKVAAREKTGKGTLIFNLLGHLERGEPTVFGAATEPVSAVIFTEEPEESVSEKVTRSNLSDALIVYGWELASLDWPAKCARLAALATEHGHGVLFVDNISRAAQVEDENGVELARAGEKLGDAARAAGLTTFIDHHHKKGAGGLADKSRGGTALAGACDNNIEMVRPGSDWTTRVRRISSRGRLSATIWEQTIALSDDGTDYKLVADDTQPQTSKERERLRKLDDAGDAGATASEFAAAIEGSDDTARRVLGEFVAKGWATLDDSEYPSRWVATGDGLKGLDF